MAEEVTLSLRLLPDSPEPRLELLLDSPLPRRGVTAIVFSRREPHMRARSDIPKQNKENRKAVVKNSAGTVLPCRPSIKITGNSESAQYNDYHFPLINST